MFAILLITIFALGVGLGFCTLQIVASSKNKTIALLQDECNELEIILFRTKAEIQEHKQILQDKQNKIDHLIKDVTNVKNPFASVIIDDRALNFDGNYSSLLEKVKEFKPYWK